MFTRSPPPPHAIGCLSVLWPLPLVPKNPTIFVPKILGYKSEFYNKFERDHIQLIKVLLIVSSTWIDNLKQKLHIIENVCVKYHGPLSVGSTKIYFHGLSFKQNGDYIHWEGCFIPYMIKIPHTSWSADCKPSAECFTSWIVFWF